MDITNLLRLWNELTDIVRKERKFLLFVLSAIGLIHLAKYFYQENSRDRQTIRILAHEAPKSDWNPSTSFQKFKHYSPSSNDIKLELHTFDPNTVSHDELIAMGIPPKVAYGLVNWRSKGKVYRTADDVSKVYGLEEKMFEVIRPYIITRSNDLNDTKKGRFPAKPIPKIIDINTASQNEFEALPGLGPYYAASILRYREALGGFHDIQQIAEIYKFPDSTFQMAKVYFNLNSIAVKKINVNDASFEQLESHPYISKKQAEEIIKERPIYGLNDLKELYFFKDPTTVTRLTPYLAY